MSSTDCYKSGRFDSALLKVLERFDQVMAIMLPSLREERAATYSPFLPIDLRTGVVLQVPVLAHDAKRGTITYEDPETQERFTVPVTGGRCKLQWKPDWAMRWVALGVDYEMAGKDLINSVKLSGEICRALGGLAPEGFNYELFLDENGQKISKSKGNGLTIDEWLRYASPGEPVIVHVSRAEGGQAALLRRHPAHRRRVSAAPRRLSAAGAEAAIVESGLAHPPGPSAQRGHAGDVHDAAHAGVLIQCRERRDAVGLHRPLQAGRDGADASEAATPSRIRHPLFPRLRAADQEVPRAERGRAQGAHRFARCARRTCRRRHGGRNPGCRL